MIAPLRSLDEFSLVHGLTALDVGAAISSRSDGSRRWGAQTFHRL
jgi:hypothetical protein